MESNRAESHYWIFRGDKYGDLKSIKLGRIQAENHPNHRSRSSLTIIIPTYSIHYHSSPILHRQDAYGEVNPSFPEGLRQEAPTEQVLQTQTTSPTRGCCGQPQKSFSAMGLESYVHQTLQKFQIFVPKEAQFSSGSPNNTPGRFWGVKENWISSHWPHTGRLVITESRIYLPCISSVVIFMDYIISPETKKELCDLAALALSTTFSL